MRRMLIVRIISVWVCIILLSACTFEVSVVATPTALFTGGTNIPPIRSETPGGAAASPTGEVTAPAGNPVSTSQPQGNKTPVPPGQSGNRVQMETGATSATVAGRVETVGRVDYLVRAGAGQFMIAMLELANQDLHLEIQAPDGKWLVNSANQQTFWQGTLPDDGDYRVSVLSSGSAATFSLGITIPVRVNFAAGAVSAALDGQIGANQINTYLLRALKGQAMTVVIDAPNRDVFLTIYGLEDGQPLICSSMGSTQATVDLPASQDYVINLVSSGEQAERYQVTFTVR